MKRTKQMINLIDDVNMYLKLNGIKSQYDPVASVVMHSLLKQNLYNGFNWYHTTMIGNAYLDIVCTEEEAEFIQIY